MNLKKISLAAALTIGILAVNGAVNASEKPNMLSDMGKTGYAAPLKPYKCPILQRTHKKKISYRKHSGVTGAAAPIHRPAPAFTKSCPAPCGPCQSGAAAPCPVPCEPCVQQQCVPVQPCLPVQPCPAPCPAPCQPCNPCK